MLVPPPPPVMCPCDLLVLFWCSGEGMFRCPVSKYSSVFLYSSDLYGESRVCQALCWTGDQGEAQKAKGVSGLKDWHCGEGDEGTGHD